MSGGRVCALAATFAVAFGGAGCGGHGPVAWKGQPRSGPVEGGRGHPLPAAAVFAGGHEAGIALQARRTYFR